MMPPTLILCVGLPRSGKSTWARASGHPVVNPDSIRLALHGQVFQQEAEPMVWAMAKYMVRALFLAGHEVVILDATNTTKKRRDEWMAAWCVVKYKVFTTTATECAARAIWDSRRDLIPIIERMAAEFEPLDAVEQLCQV